MRKEESEYWDSQARISPIMDNIFKRPPIASRLLTDGDLIGKKVLEIGIGLGNTMASIQLLVLNNFSFTATDVSPKYVDFNKRHLATGKVYQTDILNLPSIEGGFERIICLDSLEHVRPEDREKGFKEMNRVMAEHCRILINLPTDVSRHDPEFDHGFTLRDLALLEELTNTNLIKFDRYRVDPPSGTVYYKWAVLER